jgi:hypothetical protein
MRASEEVANLEKQVDFLREENQRLKNYIFEHGLEVGLIPKRVQCCSRDYDKDGKCDIHSAPGVLRNKAMQQESI